MAQDSNKNNILVNAQYIKDLSFENPLMPKGLMDLKEAPKIAVSIDVKSNLLQKNVHEVNLLITTKAGNNNKTLFIIELSYCGIFTINASKKELDRVLMVYCPNILFPYARRVISDITRDGNLPPVMLEPFDFNSLFEKHQNQKKAS